MKRWVSSAGRITGTVLIIAVVVLAMAWLAGAFRRNRIEPGVVPVPAVAWAGPTTRAVLVSRPRLAEVAGTVQAVNRSAISSRLVANILEMRASAGDRVQRGQVLVLLDDALPRARLEQARSSLLAAELARDLAQIESDRVNRAAETGAVSASERDAWNSRLAVGKAEVARAQQAVKEAEVGLNDARLTSPFDGIVIDRLAEPGEQASPGRPLLTIYDPQHLRVEAAVREGYVTRVALGQTVDVVIDTLGERRQAVIEQIVPAADPASRSFLVKAAVQEGRGLYPGMYVRLLLPLEEERVLLVPAAAIEWIGQVAYAGVVRDGALQRRAVRTGRADEQSVEILAGLEAGETVALRPEGGRP
jgi:membrane fusion protein (multidrug efflux system)